MPRALRIAVLAAIVFSFTAAESWAQAAISYRLSFPDREHHLMDVEATFSDLPEAPLQLRMSRSSPGRYALHDFAKNVFQVRVSDLQGHPLAVARPNPQGWDVVVHPSSVRVTYRVFGDRVDGTYLAVDVTHAHVNMPAAVMWARGLELSPITVHFDPPPGSGWKVATQLLPGPDPLTFTAANLQYLMDSPSEFSAFTTRTFTVPDASRTPLFRFTVHHAGDEKALDGFVRDVQRIVREERAIFGEFPAYEGNTYTFIADYLPWDSSDGMEHRNSTALTSPLAIPTGRADLLDAIAHEFFHCWNVERIRPKSLEPFDLEDVNMSGELWLAEGFTSYYGPLALKRAGLTTLTDFTADISEAVDSVLTSGARQVRTAEEMSRYAPFFDDATAIDPTAMERTFISYYAWGQAIALGLDLSLRERTNGRITLDDFMRAMWEQFGRPGGRLAGYVDHPYTIDDARAVLAAVSGDASFAQDFFSRYIQGHAAVDYAGLLARAGLVLTKAAPGRAFADVRLGDAGNGARITEAVQFDSPVYRAGLDRDDVIVEAGGSPIRSAADFTRIVEAHRPGDALRVVVDRHGGRVAATVTLVENPHSRIVPVEETGVALTQDQKHFRDNWLSSAARNGF